MNYPRAMAILTGLVAIAIASLAVNAQTGKTQSVSKGGQKTITKDMVLTRTFDAPVVEVWKHWTDSTKVKKWWGPTGFTCPIAQMDFRERGTSLVCMRAPKEFGGQDMCTIWTYHKIVPMKRIEFTSSFADKDGKRINPVSIGLPPDMPRDVRQVVTFKSVGRNKTEMTVMEHGYPSDQLVELSRAGLGECLDKMAASLK